jgi:hypothetical protein
MGLRSRSSSCYRLIGPLQAPSSARSSGSVRRITVPKPGPDSTRHCPCICLARCFIVAMPWPRSRRPSARRDAVAVVLHHQLEVAVGHLAAHAAVRGAAVLDDVAGGLAQDARGLHVGACRQVCGRSSGADQSASMPACASATPPRRASRPARRPAAPRGRSGRAPTAASPRAPRAPASRCGRSRWCARWSAAWRPGRRAGRRRCACARARSPARSSAPTAGGSCARSRPWPRARAAPAAPCRPRPGCSARPCCCTRRRPTSTSISGVASRASCAGSGGMASTWATASMAARPPPPPPAARPSARTRPTGRATAGAGRRRRRPALAAPAAPTRHMVSGYRCCGTGGQQRQRHQQRLRRQRAVDPRLWRQRA